ncbi:MAG TPA: PIN domain-containing protein [Verrucomicrobiae bacterium]|jgi:predicted nucleic acid-binding protein
MNELLLDANVLVRFLTQDDPKQGAAATALFESAERREIVLHLEALAVAEAVYVLMGRYGQPRTVVVDVLLAIIENAGVQTAEHEIVSDALQRFGGTNVDFTDAWLAARAAHFGFQVASFDRDLDKFKDVRRFDPKDAL